MASSFCTPLMFFWRWSVSVVTSIWLGSPPRSGYSVISTTFSALSKSAMTGLVPETVVKCTRKVSNDAVGVVDAVVAIEAPLFSYQRATLPLRSTFARHLMAYLRIDASESGTSV